MSLKSLALIVGLVRRAARASVDEAALEADLVGALCATGIAREITETAALWHQDDPESHLELARQFMAMAEAPDPLDPGICKAALRPELNAMIRRRWTVRWQREGRPDRASLRAVSWSALTVKERAEIRDMARTLAALHKSMAPARRPRKDDIDTILLLVAEIFADHTGTPGVFGSLPHSARSRFIQFAHETLRSFFPHEASAIALARRWQRLKKEAVDALPGTDDAW